MTLKDDDWDLLFLALGIATGACMKNEEKVMAGRIIVLAERLKDLRVELEDAE